METLSQHQELNNFSPIWTSKNNSPVGQSSYVHKGVTNSQIHNLKPARKPKSERVKVRYETKDKLVKLLTELGEDEKAKSILEKAFPGRKVIAINVEDFNVGGGGIHCATQQQPTSG